jgi:hypothetical protein
MRQMPLEHLRRPADLSPEEQQLWRACTETGPAPANAWVEMPAQEVHLGKRADDATYGWDNEYGTETVRLPAFSAARHLVSNGDFLAFIAAGGYSQKTYWTEEGRGWLGFTQAEHPKFWLRRDGAYFQRNLLEEVPLPLDWPVEVNCLEAQAYCAWQREIESERDQCPANAAVPKLAILFVRGRRAANFDRASADDAATEHRVRCTLRPDHQPRRVDNSHIGRDCDREPSEERAIADGPPPILLAPPDSESSAKDTASAEGCRQRECIEACEEDSAGGREA